MIIMYRLLLLLLILSPAAARALEATDSSAPAGTDEAAAEQTHADESAGAATIHRYRQQIASLQAQHGAYAHGLNEALAGLGRAYSQNGDHKDAAAAFKSAMYITRVNNGLYSMGQMPYLEALIGQYDSLGKLDKVSNLFSYMYWVYKRNYGARDLRTLPAIKRMREWMRKVYHRGGGLSVQQLQKLANLDYRAIGVLESNYGPFDPRLIKHLRQYSTANLYEAEVLRRKLEQRQISTSLEYCGFIMMDMNRSDDYVGKEGAMMVQERCRNYQNGRSALQRILDINKKNHLPRTSYARALTRMGDWEMVFDRLFSARDYYARAYDMLGKSKDSDKEIAELFGQPKILTAGDALDGDNNEDAAEAGDGDKDDATHGPFAVVSMDVTSAGNPRNIKVVGSKPPQDKKLQRDATQYLKQSVFRPRLENGKPVDTVGYTMTVRKDK